jgi:gliding motility-associated-like protein
VDDVLPADISVVTDASDNCGPPIVAFVSEVSNNQNCQETILRTFSVTDNCGNSVNVVQTIIVEDDIAPTASNPPTINVQCLEDVPIPDINVIADANDNCSIPVVAFVSDVSEIGICSENITRTYSITDDCNNTINVTQLIIVYDNVEPVLVTDIEGIIDITCEEVPTEPLVEFSDNCTTNVDVVFNEYINEFDDFSYDIIREWIATDYCNNSITTNQVVRVRKFNNTAKHDLVFCIEDETFDINSLLDFGGDTNSGWESDSMNLLEDGILNPADTPLGNYQFVHTYNQNGCIQTTNATIGIHDDCVEFTCIESEAYVDIPKIVTPNNDGFNDVFEILYTIDERSDDSCDIVLDVKIFNRWGTRVYQSGNYQNDWSGNSPSSGMGGSDYLPTGTYFYIVELKSSGLKPIQGYIYLGTN